MAEAVAHLTRGLRALQDLPPGPDRDHRELGLQLTLGQALIAAKGFAAAETGQAYGCARELCRRLGDVPELFPVLYGQSVFHFQRGELGAAQEVARDLLRQAIERGDAAAQVTGHRMVGSALCQLGRFTESRDSFEAALALYDPERDRTSALIYAIDSRVMSLSWLSHIYLLLGYPDQAMERHRAVPAFVSNVAVPATAAVALAWGCIFLELIRDWHGAAEQADATIALATEQGFPLYRAAGLVVRGWALAEGGCEQDGVREICQGLVDYAGTGAEMWLPYFQGLLAKVQLRSGDITEGLHCVDNALERAERTGIRWIEADLLRTKGELLLKAGEPVRAEAAFRRAIAIARHQGTKLFQLRSATSLAGLCEGQGRRAEAHDLVAPLNDQFTEGLDTPDLRDAKMLLRALQG
jgi:predicted ATPase